MSETKVKNKISFMILVVILAAACVAVIAGCSGLSDKVSYNEFSGSNEEKEVTQLFRNASSELTRLTTCNGQEILSTPSHPYYTQRGYVDAQNLRAGDVLRTVNGEAVIVEAVQHEILEAPVVVYNFEVEDNHNYFVGNNTSSSVLVHNFCVNELTKTKTTVIGKEHGCDIHRNGIIKQYTEMVDSGKYDIIYLNRSLKTAGYNGTQRPDIIGIQKGGTVEYWEFASPSQASGKPYNDLLDKMKAIEEANEGFIRHLKKWLEY